jgi:hypothetical protein
MKVKFIYKNFYTKLKNTKAINNIRTKFISFVFLFLLKFKSNKIYYKRQKVVF